MSDHYYFPGQFKCMYCKVDLNNDKNDFPLALSSDDNIDLKCPKCGAIWKFWVKVQLLHKLVKKGKYNKR